MPSLSNLLIDSAEYIFERRHDGQQIDVQLNDTKHIDVQLYDA